MRNISESFKNIQSLSALCNSESIDEGLKDWINSAKNLFGQVWKYLKGVVAKFGTYFLPVDESGEVMPSITPMTAGQAYKEGVIKNPSTFVCLDKSASNIVGLRNKPSDALNVNKESTLDYWIRLYKNYKPMHESFIDEASLANQDKQAKYTSIDTDMLKKLIHININARKANPLLIWGAPGIGKTAILNCVLDEFEDIRDKGYSLICKTLSTETRESFFLPDYCEVNGEKRATDIPKTWMPVYKDAGDPIENKKRSDACGHGILFIDELSRASQGVLNVMLPLVNERRLGEYVLGDGWTIICASNRLEDDPTSDQAQLGSAMLNRFSQYTYNPTINTWENWAKTQGFISPLLLQWLSLPESETMSGGKYFYWDPNIEDPDDSYSTLICTPRAWTNAMQQLANFQETADLEGFKILDIPENIVAMVLNSCIPSAAIDSFLSFLNVIRKIGGGGQFDQIVRDVWRNGGKGFKINKKNLGLVTIPLAQLVLTSHADKLPTTEEFKNLAKWLVSMDNESLMSATMDVFKNTYCAMITSDNMMQCLFDASQIEPDKKDTFAEFGAVKQFLTNWHVSIDEFIEKYSWTEGLDILADKYADALERTTFAGQSALD